MWHRQIRGRQLLSRKTDNVEVEGAGAPTLTTKASGGLLDSVQLLEQRTRLESGFERDHLVKIGSLILGTDRRGFLDVRLGENARFRQASQRRPCLCQICSPIPFVRSERDER